MSDTTYTSGVVITSDWLNDVNKKTYRDTINVKVLGAVGDGTTDDTSVIQSALTTYPGRTIYFPKGTYKITTTLTISSGTKLVGDGTTSQIHAWGCNAITANSDHVYIDGMALMAYSAVGVADPRTTDGIVSPGTSGTHKNYLHVSNVFAQGWNRCVELEYTDGSTVDNLTTVNSNYGVRLFGQSVNNVIRRSRLVVNGGTASIAMHKDGATQGEGLMVTDCLLASGTNAVLSDGFLSLGVYNCTVDLIQGDAFEFSGVTSITIDCPWVYSAGRCFDFAAQGSSINLDANIKVGLATCTGSGTSLCVMGANNVGLTISGGTFHLTNAAGGLPFVFSGNKVAVGPVVIHNATSNSDIQINGSDIRISQEAIFSNGIQTVVSQIRSVASATTTALPYPTGAMWELFYITGNTNCTSLTDPAAWQGRAVTLRFTGTPTWTDGGNLVLNGNFVATAEDTLTLVSTGSSWVEVARSAN